MRHDLFRLLPANHSVRLQRRPDAPIGRTGCEQPRWKRFRVIVLDNALQTLGWVIVALK